jgi:hypothetical protein
VRSGRATSPPTASLAPGAHTVDALFLAAGPYETSQASTSLQVQPAPTPSGGGGGGGRGGGPSGTGPVAPTAPPPAPATPATPGSPPPPRLELHGERLRVDARGSFALDASCAGPAGTTCRERVTLRRAAADDATTLATRLVSVEAGHRERLRWDLSRRGERLLRRHTSVVAGWQRTAGDQQRFRLIGTRAPALVPRTLRAAGRGARLRLTCPRGSTSCHARVRLHAGRRTAGTATVSLAPGRTATRAVRLRSWARGALPARVRVTLRCTVPVGRARTVARTLRVRP